MHDVACEFARAVVRSKDAQKQLARTSLSNHFWPFHYRFGKKILTTSGLIFAGMKKDKYL